MELTEPEMAYLRRFSSENAVNIFGPGSIFKACWGYIDDLVFLSIPKAQWQIDWDSFPIPLTPEVPFPWASLDALRQRADEARKEKQQRENVVRLSLMPPGVRRSMSAPSDVPGPPQGEVERGHQE